MSLVKDYKHLDKSSFSNIKKIKFSIKNEEYCYFYSPEFRSKTFLTKYNFDFDNNKLFGSVYNKSTDTFVSDVGYNNKYNQNSTKVYNYLKHKYRITRNDFYKEHLIILYKNLFQSNIGIINKTIHKYINCSGILEEDCYDIAIFSLQKSINAFCPFYKIQFSTYLVNAIKYNLYNKIINKKNKLKIFNLSSFPESLELKFNNESIAIEDTNVDEKDRQVKVESMISNAMNQLDKRKQKIISLRFGLNGNKEHNLDETGEIFNLSKERIRQIQKDSMEKMLNYFDKNDVAFDS